MTYLLAVLAALSNATSFVLQRRAHLAHPVKGSLVEQVRVVLTAPSWILGIGAVIGGFLLQAAALDSGAISVVEPVLIAELPLTLLLGALAFRRRPATRDLVAAGAMSIGVAGILLALAPQPRPGESVPPFGWVVGLPVSAGAVLMLYLAALKVGGERRAALLGVATGTAFGLTVALTKSVTNALNHGLPALLEAWQTYAMMACGLAAMVLMQAAFNAGSLVAAQPGMTLADPVVSGLWGVLGYREIIRDGWYLVGALACAVLIAAGVQLLARSPLLQNDPDKEHSLPAEGAGGEHSGDTRPEREQAQVAPGH